MCVCVCAHPQRKDTTLMPFAARGADGVLAPLGVVVLKEKDDIDTMLLKGPNRRAVFSCAFFCFSVFVFLVFVFMFLFFCLCFRFSFLCVSLHPATLSSSSRLCFVPRGQPSVLSCTYFIALVACLSDCLLLVIACLSKRNLMHACFCAWSLFIGHWSLVTQSDRRPLRLRRHRRPIPRPHRLRRAAAPPPSPRALPSSWLPSTLLPFSPTRK